MEAPQAQEFSRCMTSTLDGEPHPLAGPRSSDAGSEQRSSATGRKRVKRTISLPVPPPSPFLPYATSDFSVPLESLLSSSLSETSTTSDSSDGDHATARKVRGVLPVAKGANAWRTMPASPAKEQAGRCTASKAGKSSTGARFSLCSCFGTTPMYAR